MDKDPPNLDFSVLAPKEKQYTKWKHKTGANKDDGTTPEQWIWNYEENLRNWCSRITYGTNWKPRDFLQNVNTNWTMQKKKLID